MNKYQVRNFKWRENLGKVPAKVYRLVSRQRAAHGYITIYCLTVTIVTVLLKFRFQKTRD